jgi:RNase H-like domain found in reverse transcriptase
MWIRRSNILAPLATLTSKGVPWKWSEEHQCSFDLMKWIVSQETLLAYSDFSKPFDVYTNGSHSQLGAAICQNYKPFACYCCKLNPTSMTERELLAIIETLKEFRNILLGHKIRIFTDLQNLTYKIFQHKMYSAMASTHWRFWPWAYLYQGSLEWCC